MTGSKPHWPGTTSPPRVRKRHENVRSEPVVSGLPLLIIVRSLVQLILSRAKMAKNNRKVIISCAITGSVHTPTMSEYLPVTPSQIVESAVEAAEAGAAILHIHARNGEDGRPSGDPARYREICPVLAERTSVDHQHHHGRQFGYDDRATTRLSQPGQTRDVFAEHGIDELLHSSRRRADHKLAL